MEHQNLLDLKIKTKLDSEDKRYLLMLLSIRMKKYHEQNKMVTSFKPEDIIYQDGSFDFLEVKNISPLLVNDKDTAILHNIIGLANLGFCLFLPDYDIANGLLDKSVVSDRFNSFVTIFDEKDRDYFKSVLVDARNTGQLPAIPYYYDYAVQKEKSDTSKGQSPSLIRATEAGKYMADKEEAAFGDIFFFVTITASMLIGIGSLLIFFLK